MTHLKWIGSREFSGAGRMRGERSIDLSWLIASAAAAINHHCRQHELRIDKEWSRKPGKTTLAELATILPDLIRAPRVVAHKRRSKVFLREDLAEIVQQENERLGGWHEMPYRKFLDADAVDLLLGDEDTLNVRPAQHECSTDTIAGDSGTQNAQTLHGDAIARPLTIVAAGQSSEQRLRDALNHIEGFYRDSDRYWNATEMAKIYSHATGTRKEVGDWLRLGATESLLTMVSENTGIPVFNLTEVIQGRNGGTWIHPLLVHAFAQWLSPEFYVLVSAHLDTWHKESEPTAIASYQHSITREDVADITRTTIREEMTPILNVFAEKLTEGFARAIDKLGTVMSASPSVQVRQVNHNTANAGVLGDREACERMARNITRALLESDGQLPGSPDYQAMFGATIALVKNKAYWILGLHLAEFGFVPRNFDVVKAAKQDDMRPIDWVEEHSFMHQLHCVYEKHQFRGRWWLRSGER